MSGKTATRRRIETGRTVNRIRTLDASVTQRMDSRTGSATNSFSTLARNPLVTHFFCSSQCVHFPQKFAKCKAKFTYTVSQKTTPMQRTITTTYITRRVSVRLCVCVCVSVTLRNCIKMAKRRITQIMPHDRSGTLVYTDKRVTLSLCHSRASC